MAKNLLTTYPGKVNPSSPQYPYGEPKNVNVNGDGTGTPFEAEWCKDIAGFHQAILTEAGIVPSNNPDNAVNSQYLEGLKKVTEKHYKLAFFDTFAEMQASTIDTPDYKLICRERDNAEYIVQTNPYTAESGDVTLASGFVGSLQEEGGLYKLSWFLDLEEAINRQVPIDMTGYGTYNITSPLTITVPIDLRCKDDSKIVGYDGTGIIFSGDKLYFEGINVEGFYDGTDQNKTNYTTMFMEIATGTTVDEITVKNCTINTCRSFIRVGSPTSDITVITDVFLNNIIIDSNFISNSPSTFQCRCSCQNVKVINNTCIDSIGASRSVGPFQFYTDGQGYAAPIYALAGEMIFTGNYFHTIVNRTTTGDSTSGNSYECHAIQASANNIIINDNIIIDNTGVAFDCEAIYTKARHVNICNNVIVDGGSTEGAINVKGNSVEGDPSNTSPFGEYSQVSGNHIIFTRDTYDNDGTIVNLTTVGIHCATPTRAIITNNVIDGSNDAAIVMDGNPGTSVNTNTIVSDNICHNLSGATFIRYRGAFENGQCNNNTCTKVLTDGKSFYMIDLIAVVNRGVVNRNLTFRGNTLEVGNHTSNESGFIHAFIRIDSENYDFEGLNIKDNTIDILPTLASARPIYITAQTGSPTGLVYDLVVKDNVFKNNHYVTGPVFFSRQPSSFDISLDYDWKSTSNVSQNALLIATLDDTSIDANFRVISTRDDLAGFGQRDRANFIGYTSAGTLTVIDNTSDTPVGNATGIGVDFATLDNDLRVRINGNDTETWNHRIHLNVVCR